MHDTQVHLARAPSAPNLSYLSAHDGPGDVREAQRQRARRVPPASLPLSLRAPSPSFTPYRSQFVSSPLGLHAPPPNLSRLSYPSPQQCYERRAGGARGASRARTPALAPDPQVRPALARHVHPPRLPPLSPVPTLLPFAARAPSLRFQPFLPTRALRSPCKQESEEPRRAGTPCAPWRG
jgi:hypothetical protein